MSSIRSVDGRDVRISARDELPYVFVDEASECGDGSLSMIGKSRKHRDWAAEVESEQQQEMSVNADSITDPATVSRDAGERGGRRGWRRARPSNNREGAH
jgi:hypothetical protein